MGTSAAGQPGEARPAPIAVPGVDWEVLRGEADAAAERAYAPYSGLRVGAAGVTSDGRLLTACNVESASYGLTLCAECGLVSALAVSGGGRLVAVAITAGDGRPLSPCGRCRQLLAEHGGPRLLVDSGPGKEPATIAELLPGAFDRAELDARRGEAP